MKPTTRSRILEYFRKNQTATVSELSHLMGMTGANIRHHLEVLESNEILDIIGQRKEGRGRPMLLYGLSQRMIGDGLEKLAGTLLDVWLGAETEKRREEALLSVAERLVGRMDLNIPVMKRLVNTVERLNELNYQARWEASAVGPRLILGHCPYAAIVSAHPELCQLDKKILQTNLGSPMELTTKLQLGDKGLPFCVFLMVGNG